MSVEVEKEITVVIPSSKVADPEFIQQEVTKAQGAQGQGTDRRAQATLEGVEREAHRG